MYVFARGDIKLHLVDTYPQNSREESEDGKTRVEERKKKRGCRRKNVFSPPWRRRVVVLRRGDLSKIVSSPSISFPG